MHAVTEFKAEVDYNIGITQSFANCFIIQSFVEGLPRIGLLI